MSESEISDDGVVTEKTSKKRKGFGRLRDVLKKVRVQSHEPGADCKCRMKCFERISLEARDAILNKFNLMENTNEQNSYLCGLISIVPVQRRRPRLNPNDAKYKDVTCKYKVRHVVDGVVSEFDVCRKGFSAIHGISKKKVEYLINSLKWTGSSPKDQRGKHLNRKHAIPEETKEMIKAHINSFKGRGAHYCLKDSKKKYLPEDLNISKMHKLFKELHPNIPVSYDSYRSVFNTDFNISFGYPRTDTCSFCDEMNIKLESMMNDLKSVKSQEERVEIEESIKKKETELKLHKLKAQKFYDLKRKARKAASKTKTFEAICIDYGKNLSVPNVSTNDVYYRRQLSVFCFIIHILSNNTCYFFVYPESDGKKGSDNVCQMLFEFLKNHLDNNVENLQIYADSCGGQNKNITMIRFLHYMTHVQKRFKTVQITFPIRGHSYMETDKDMALVKKNFRAELPSDWTRHIRDCRQKPNPYVVVEVDYTFWRSWTVFFNLTYKKKLCVKTRPIREIKFTSQSERLMYFRNNYSGPWENTVITLPVRRRFNVEPSTLPDHCHTGKNKLILFSSRYLTVY